MKIAFLLTQSLDSPSGLGRFGPLARELAKLGHEVELFALHPNWAALPQKQFVDRGVRVHYVSQMHVKKIGNHKLYFSPPMLLWVSLLATLRLAWALFRSKAEIVQLCKPQPFNVVAAWLGGRKRPIFCDCDDYEAATNQFGSQRQQAIVRYFEDSIVNFAAGISSNTSFTRQRYIDLGYPAEKIVLVPNGVERERIATKSEPILPAVQQWGQPNAPLILYVGTLGLVSHPVDLLLEAFVLVRQEMPKAQLLLVGGGEDYDKLKQMAHELGLGDSVCFAGRVAPTAVPAYLRLATVSVDPVHDDWVAKARSPLKIVESLAMGVPVVSSDVGDRRAMLDNGQLGELVAAGDANALANGICGLLRDEGKQTAVRQRMAQNQATAWDWATLTTQFLQVYRR